MKIASERWGRCTGWRSVTHWACPPSRCPAPRSWPGTGRLSAGFGRGRPVVAGRGEVDAAALARDLLAWEESIRARGSLDLLGPSTRQALAALAAGTDIAKAGRRGVTNGAAMRVAPVGIATSSRDPRLLEDRVVAASRLTHNTGVALAGAAAVAAAVSAGIDGDPLPVAIGRAVAAAASAASRGHWTAGADVATRISWATGLATGLA